MKQTTLRFSTLATLATLALFASTFTATSSAQELKVLVHNSFSLPKPLLAKFEQDSGIKLSIIKAGDAGEIINKLILTRAQPLGDVVYGVDNTLIAKAQAAGVLDAYSALPSAPTATATPTQTAAPQRTGSFSLGPSATAIGYSYVTLNYDKTSFAKSNLALPKTLEELTQPLYRNMLVVQNPATSSPGHAFMLATIASMGEAAAFDWWARMRANGVKVAKGWSDAYYTEFSRNGGKHPLVVSYATSPAAEVFYSKEKITEPPTASLFLKGGVFQQVEGVALVKGGAQREAGIKFIEFMRSAPAQEAMQTSMWMFPVEAGVARADVMRHAPEPASYDSLSQDVILAKSSDWVSRWTRVVLK